MSDHELLAAAAFAPIHGGLEHPQGGEPMPAWRRGQSIIVQVAPGAWALCHPRLESVYFEQCQMAIAAALATPAAIAACQRRAAVRGWAAASAALLLLCVLCVCIVLALDAQAVIHPTEARR